MLHTTSSAVFVFAVSSVCSLVWRRSRRSRSPSRGCSDTPTRAHFAPHPLAHLYFPLSDHVPSPHPARLRSHFPLSTQSYIQFFHLICSHCLNAIRPPQLLPGSIFLSSGHCPSSCFSNPISTSTLVQPTTLSPYTPLTSAHCFILTGRPT